MSKARDFISDGLKDLGTAGNRGRDELADALRAFPDSIGKSYAQAEDAEPSKDQKAEQDKPKEKEIEI